MDGMERAMDWDVVSDGLDRTMGWSAEQWMGWSKREMEQSER